MSEAQREERQDSRFLSVSLNLTFVFWRSSARDRRQLRFRCYCGLDAISLPSHQSRCESHQRSPCQWHKSWGTWYGRRSMQGYEGGLTAANISYCSLHLTSLHIIFCFGFLLRSFWQSHPEIAKRYGGDCTVSALDNRFRRVKADAKLLNDALAQGIDPITITTDSLNGKVGNGKGTKQGRKFLCFSFCHMHKYIITFRKLLTAIRNFKILWRWLHCQFPWSSFPSN